MLVRLAAFVRRRYPKEISLVGVSTLHTDLTHDVRSVLAGAGEDAIVPEDYEWVVVKDSARENASEPAAPAVVPRSQRSHASLFGEHQSDRPNRPTRAVRGMRPGTSLRSQDGRRGQSMNPERDRVALLMLAGLAVTVALVILAQLLVVRHGW
jgi:hypothetical protein